MSSGEVGVAFYNLLRVRAIDQVIVERASFCAKRVGLTRLLAEVEPGAPGVVQEQPITVTGADTEEKGDALIYRIDRFLGAMSVFQSV